MKCRCLILAGVFALALMLAGAVEVTAYPNYNGNGQPSCSSCHPGFLGGFSGPLHGTHLTMTSSCTACHGVPGDNPILNSSPLGPGCVGCHGRLYPLPDGDSGVGLRLHHTNAGAPPDGNGFFCLTCHPSATEPSPVKPENVLPAYYGAATFNVTDTCERDPGLGGEDYLGNGRGLDNDGDLLYDGDDPDCQPDLCGDGTVDPGEDCDGGECCAADCTWAAADTACGDPSDTECDNPDTCDGAGICEPNYAAGGSACGDQGVECLVDDACDGAGACTDNGLEPDGTACGDASADQCDNADSCLAGVCDPNWVGAGTPCDDSLFCNENEACDGGGACGGGNAVDCSDVVGCTDDSCDEAAGACVNTANDANCPDDLMFCTGDEFCDPVADCSSTGDPCDPATETCNEGTDACDPLGECGNGVVDPGEDCDGGECCSSTCTFEPAGFVCGDQGVECLADDACDGAGACTDNGLEPDGTACGDASADQCDNADSCLAGVCDPNWVGAGTPCDDSLFCNENEACDGGGACGGGNAVDCSDVVGCTDDSCDEAAGACVNTANDANCPDDLMFCTGDEFCDPVDDCSSTGDPCDPATETCNEGTDACDPLGECGNGVVDPGEDCDGGECCSSTCTFEPAGFACGDQGVECLADDACDGAGACTDNGLEPDGTACGDASADQCDNADSCLAGVCDPNWVGAGTPCDDSLFCNENEACDGGGACVGGNAVDCSDVVGCTDDSCDEAAGACVNTANDANCPDDLMFCTGDEFCDPVADCSSTGDPCDPATETCDEVNDICEPIGCTSDADCDDRLFCNGAETCDLASGECLPGTPVDVDDGVGCTDDSCDEVNDRVVNTPNDAFCDDGAFCNGAEFCDPGLDCQAGTPPNVDDGVGCTDDSCDEATDTIVHAPNDGLCPDDGMFCTGSEFCDPVADCSSTGDPCGPGETCNETTDVCEQPTGEVDLDIFKFKVSKRANLAKPKPIRLRLRVRNGGSVDEPRLARITGRLPDGSMVTVFDMPVSDPVGGGATSYSATYMPTMPGVIRWTAEIFDDDPDVDLARARTRVFPGKDKKDKDHDSDSDSDSR